jgi:hypothetical protein
VVQEANVCALVQLLYFSSCALMPLHPLRRGRAFRAATAAFLFLAQLEVEHPAAALSTSAAEVLRARGIWLVGIIMLDMLSLGRPLPLFAQSSLVLRLTITMPAPGRVSSATVSPARTG